MGKIRIDGFSCERCKHVWIPRTNWKDKPRVCPRCKSPYWDIPKKRNKK